ncbi:hypothetical protein HK101_001893 [Irineochytrium annulatum]|nr:hypothetical protein HK101_001893 [Irineochytrium annulatum]
MPCNLKASASVASLWSTSSSKGSKIQKRRPRKLKTKYGSSSSSPSPSPSRGVLSSPRISPLRMTVAGLLIVFVATVARHYDPACAAHLRAAPSDVVTPGSAPPWSHQVLSATRVARGIPAAAQCVMSSVATSFRDFVVGDVAAVVDGEASRSAIEAPSDAVAHLIECSDDNVMDLIQDLAVLPSSLNVSLSAHAALSLAASVQAVMDAETDVDEVADSLNAASDSILHLSTKGFTISRQVHRRLHALLRAVSTAMMPAGASPARHASAKGSPSQQPQYHQASTITAERLQKLLDDAIEDMDAGLQELEARVHGCQVRAVEADTLWREAEKVAERERVRAERRGDRAAASSFSSSSRDRREREDDEAAKGRWTWSGIFAGGASKGDEHGKAQDVVVVAKRTERDLQLLRGVIGTLNGMSGSIVKLDLDVKRLRAHLQDFRGRIGAAAAEAERTWSGWREEGGLDALWGRLGRMEDALTGLRVREPVLPPN